MNYLFLRGQVPVDRNPQEIVFDRIEDVDDVWTQLIFKMTCSQDYTELWYWGGRRKKEFSENFVERWIPSFKDYTPTFIPDVIFCRGGFTEYTSVLQRYPCAFKIYYGAGIRFYPQPDFTDYDLVLVDSDWQLERVKEKFPHLTVSKFIKPAPDNLFFPREFKKTYDVCFPADGRTQRKGHDFVFSTLPKTLNVLNLGARFKWRPKPSNVTVKRVLKTEIPQYYGMCSVGIVASTLDMKGGLDSCPRVLPEMLACDLPVVVLDETLCWQEKYVNEYTGLLANREDFWEKVFYVLNNTDQFSPREYYMRHLSLEPAAKFLRGLICA